ERAGGCGGQPAVLERVRGGEHALPDVGPPTPGVDLLVAPRVLPLLQSAPRGVLPLGLGGKASTGPHAVRLRVVPADVHDGMIAQALDAREGPAGAAPVRAAYPDPPGRLGRATEQVLLVGGDGEMEHGGESEHLGLGAVSGGVDEAREVVV